MREVGAAEGGCQQVAGSAVPINESEDARWSQSTKCRARASKSRTSSCVRPRWSQQPKGPRGHPVTSASPRPRGPQASKEASKQAKAASGKQQLTVSRQGRRRAAPACVSREEADRPKPRLWAITDLKRSSSRLSAARPTPNRTARGPSYLGRPGLRLVPIQHDHQMRRRSAKTGGSVGGSTTPRRPRPRVGIGIGFVRRGSKAGPGQQLRTRATSRATAAHRYPQGSDAGSASSEEGRVQKTREGE
ncbi:uncharacterized protein PSFLO_04936 [Pseudozyma flocculosa]|uniref:Uncharacterized protein n=1 Tax=Pseudozyma flocculosa TaxID=84751 RepID=A0A5C3F6T3_9BASI|nr:uncharacterized protein PSFLO_04936 [Pseudozyma flocculosa]